MLLNVAVTEQPTKSPNLFDAGNLRLLAAASPDRRVRLRGVSDIAKNNERSVTAESRQAKLIWSQNGYGNQAGRNGSGVIRDHIVAPIVDWLSRFVLINHSVARNSVARNSTG